MCVAELTVTTATMTGSFWWHDIHQKTLPWGWMFSALTDSFIRSTTACVRSRHFKKKQVEWMILVHFSPKELLNNAYDYHVHGGDPYWLVDRWLGSGPTHRCSNSGDGLTARWPMITPIVACWFSAVPRSHWPICWFWRLPSQPPPAFGEKVWQLPCPHHWHRLQLCDEQTQVSKQGGGPSRTG